MLFSSITFLWIFLPIVIIGNFLLSAVPTRKESTRIQIKNTFLLVASFIFYAYGGVAYLGIMVLVILVNFVAGFLVSPERHGKTFRKVFLVLDIVVNFGVLFFFKYFNMFGAVCENIIEIAHGSRFKDVWPNLINLKGTGSLNLFTVVLPIGISFYIFQAISYVVDVYRGKAKVQGRLSAFALYVSFFPQLIAGPIVQYSDVEEQITSRKESITLFSSGVKKFCYGLGKKVIIANTLAEVADGIWALDISSIGASLAWLGMISYTLQIYYDFSGYSDMAIGLGRMFGFTFKENFNYPYLSLSIQEFWRSWHISLSSWFREYVYIPLGGSKCSRIKTYRNIFIVFLLTGVWHGANFTYWIWGLIYAFLLIIERMFLGKVLKNNPRKELNWIYTQFFVMIAWVYFRSDSVSQARMFIRQLFSKGTGEYTVLSFLSMNVLIVLAVAILLEGFVQAIFYKLYQKISKCYFVNFVDIVLQIAVFAYSIMLIISGTYNPFIYFQF